MEKYFYNPEIKLLDGGVIQLGDVLNRWSFSNLSAPYWRFYSNDREGARLRLDGETYELFPGEGVLISPNTPISSCSSDERIAHLNIHFIAAPPYSDIEPQMIRFRLSPHLNSLVKAAMSLPGDWREVDAFSSMLLLRIVLEALLEIPASELIRPDIDPRVDEAIHFLRRNWDRPVDNRTLAGDAKMSLNGFLRLFRRDAGTSPQKFKSRLQIEQACLLLHHSNLSIDEIAMKTGFCDRYYFSHVFKARCGVSPAKFKLRNAALRAP